MAMAGTLQMIDRVELRDDEGAAQGGGAITHDSLDPVVAKSCVDDFPWMGGWMNGWMCVRVSEKARERGGLR